MGDKVTSHGRIHLRRLHQGLSLALLGNDAPTASVLGLDFSGDLVYRGKKRASVASMSGLRLGQGHSIRVH